jgi:hypothetical protein
MVILTEGVHNGSEGPILYPQEELSKTPVVWNHKPIVVYHPTMNGVGISACDPLIINSRKIGVMLNTKFEGGRLKSEAWIEKGRADIVDNRIMVAVDKKEMMELSTGVFVDNDATPGEWKGEAYVGVARNYRPDHLALLPDQIGACSIADGAGFLRNTEKGKTNSVFTALRKALGKIGLMDNEMSHSNISQSLCEALRKRNNAEGQDAPYLWVQDVYSNFVVYEFGGKLYRLGYTTSDTGIVLSDEPPAEVVRVTEYRTASGTFVGNQTPSQPNKQNTDMNKKELVDAIISNTQSLWKESDRAALMAFTEDQLKIVQNGLTPPKTEPAKVEATKVEAVVPATNQTPVKITVVDFINQAPPEIQEVLRNSLAVHNEEKDKMVMTIMAHKQNAFTKEELDAMSMKTLRNMAKMAVTESARPTANYAGQAPVPTGTDVEEALEVPVMNFAKA